MVTSLHSIYLKVFFLKVIAAIDRFLHSWEVVRTVQRRPKEIRCVMLPIINTISSFSKAGFSAQNVSYSRSVWSKSTLRALSYRISPLAWLGTKNQIAIFYLRAVTKFEPPPFTLDSINWDTRSSSDDLLKLFYFVNY